MIQRLSAGLGKYGPLAEKALADLETRGIVARVWRHDYSVWQGVSAGEPDRLGWLCAPEEMSAKVDHLEAFAAEVRAAGYTDVLLLGMGGSSLAPGVLSQVFSGDRRGIKLQVLDSTDPGAVLAHAGRLDPARTLFLVATKSGTTVETLSFFKFFYNWTTDALQSSAESAKHFVAITDPGTPLEEVARRLSFRRTFLNNPAIGGRFSVLSGFGLVPAALLGLDLNRLLSRAEEMARCCQRPDSAALQLGAAMGALAQAAGASRGSLPSRDKLTLIASKRVASFGCWVEQLVAESTGKGGTGILPVEGELPGEPTAYGDDRLFVYLQLEGDEEHSAALAALQDAGHPVICLSLRDRYDLGEQFYLWEFATSVACHLLQVNVFDQPNVEASKRAAREMVAVFRQNGSLPSVESAPLTADALTSFIADARPPAYLALQAYVNPTPATQAALLALRTRLRDRFKLAATVGFGPRFLHSTGQLHKGDAGNGLFVQFTADVQQDAPIPDEAGKPDSSISFGVLEAAQASGDRQALLNAGRRVIRFHLDSQVSERIQRLADSV